MLRKLLLSIYITTSIAHAAAPTPPKHSILLLDTVGRASFVYKPFMDYAQEAGIACTYYSFDQFADEQNPQALLEQHHGIMFVFGLEFLSGVQDKSPLSEKVMELFRASAKKKNFIVGMAFPNFNIKANNGGIVNKMPALFQPLLQQQLPLSLLLTQRPPHETTINHFLALTNEFLCKPLMSRPCDFHTTLQAPHPGTPFFHGQINNILRREGEKLVALPRNSTDQSGSHAKTINKLTPFGLYWFNPIHQNHIFISSNTALTFSSIKEDFHLCPVSNELRNEMNQQVRQMVFQLKQLVTTGSLKNLSRATPTTFHKKRFAKKSERKKKKTAWMEISPFQQPFKDNKPVEETPEQLSTRERQQDKLIEYILKAHLDTLWISITPNILFSPIARETHREGQILSAVSRFTQKLAAQAQQRNIALPKLLLGFEITNNVYEPNLPKQPAVDLYGSDYPDLPHPLDINFWNNEIITPLQTFVQHWNNPTVSHGIPLSGIVIDLEMYCRRKSGTFLETMGFDQPTFERYRIARSSLKAASSPHDMIRELTNNQRCQDYFAFLEQEAEAIGKHLDTQVAKILPHGSISCYMPSILVDWFYKGLMRGLTHHKKPLHLFTFNTVFTPHEAWFTSNNIPTEHSSVLLLSKLQKTKDFSWIKHILAQHDGIWLNRFSRLVEPYEPKSWITVEQTPLSDDGKEALVKAIKKH